MLVGSVLCCGVWVRGRAHACLPLCTSLCDTALLCALHLLHLLLAARPLLLQAHVGPVTALAVSADGTMCASISTDRTAKVRQQRGWGSEGAVMEAFGCCCILPLTD